MIIYSRGEFLREFQRSFERNVVDPCVSNQIEVVNVFHHLKFGGSNDASETPLWAHTSYSTYAHEGQAYYHSPTAFIATKRNTIAMMENITANERVQTITMKLDRVIWVISGSACALLG